MWPTHFLVHSRQVTVEELNEATGGFPDSAKLGESEAGVCYRGVMQVIHRCCFCSVVRRVKSR